TYFISRVDVLNDETIYQFGPSSIEPGEAMDLEIAFDPASYPDFGKLFIYQKNGEAWTALQSRVRPEKNVVGAKVTSLGEFKIVYDATFTGNNTVPESYALRQNYPNPFNPTTTIRYDLPEDGFLTIRIYNLLGQAVRTLYRGNQSAGFHSVMWDGSNERGQTVASGIYLYRLESRQFIRTMKMTFVK
ncbi:MAG: T9SS type A sorting domain-containing protein, partial [Ignavibacteriae bacterium]|nr:T9SS type A sorting domain-containing protein [Ignavibacteriota bacterium]